MSDSESISYFCPVPQSQFAKIPEPRRPPWSSVGMDLIHHKREGTFEYRLHFRIPRHAQGSLLMRCAFDLEADPRCQYATFGMYVRRLQIDVGLLHDLARRQTHPLYLSFRIACSALFITLADQFVSPHRTRRNYAEFRFNKKHGLRNVSERG